MTALERTEHSRGASRELWFDRDPPLSPALLDLSNPSNVAVGGSQTCVPPGDGAPPSGLELAPALDEEELSVTRRVVLPLE
jgi:hypothetical protein